MYFYERLVMTTWEVTWRKVSYWQVVQFPKGLNGMTVVINATAVVRIWCTWRRLVKMHGSLVMLLFYNQTSVIKRAARKGWWVTLDLKELIRNAQVRELCFVYLDWILQEWLAVHICQQGRDAKNSKECQQHLFLCELLPPAARSCLSSLTARPVTAQKT